MKHHRSPRAIIWMMALALSFLLPAAHAQEAVKTDDIVGVWAADDGTVKLDMYKEGSEYKAKLLYGNKLVEADNVTFKNDVKNPDPTLRSRSMKQVVFIWGLHWDDGEWTDGSLYDGSSGRTYHCQVQMKDGKMHLRGYIGLPALGQTRVFHRADA